MMTSEDRLLGNIKKYAARNYQNEAHSIWHRLPIARRSAVFILLFLGSAGELRVVLTKRSSKLRNFPGHVSFPGGKADDGLESEWQVSRREMEEEIGLDSNNETLLRNHGISIEHINALPCFLSRTFLAVRPCVGFMRFSNENEVLSSLKLKLNPGESSSIFSCPLRDFLYPAAKEPAREALERVSHRIKWGGIPWSLRSYTFPYSNENEASWLNAIQDTSATESETSENETEDTSVSEKVSKKNKLSSWGRLGSRRDSETSEKIYDVWGLTANILHELACIVYLPENQKLNTEVGEEELIYSIWKFGNQMRQKDRSPEEVKLINSNTSSDFGFGDILPRSEFLRLKQVYK